MDSTQSPHEGWRPFPDTDFVTLLCSIKALSTQRCSTAQAQTHAMAVKYVQARDVTHNFLLLRLC